MKKSTALTSLVATYGTLVSTLSVSANAGEVSNKLNQAGNQIQSILTGLLVLVGVCVALFIIIKKLPIIDDPREKSELFRSVGSVAGAVAVGAAVVWLLPWVFSLFN